MADYNRGIKLPGEILNQQEIRCLLAACNRGPSGARNRALLVVLWRAGLRTAEALALRASDLDSASGLVRVRRGKAGKPRWVGMDTEAFTTVEAWLARREGLGLNGHAHLFCTLQGRPLDAGYCRAMIKQLARRADLRKRAHLHGLRHSHAVELAKRDVPRVVALKVVDRGLVGYEDVAVLAAGQAGVVHTDVDGLEAVTALP